MTHPRPDHLSDYAAGSLSAGMSLLVASHLTFCPHCRDWTARLETLGGAFLQDQRAEGVAAPDLGCVLPRLDRAGAPQREAPPEDDDPVLPRPLRQALGQRVDAIRWRFLLPGLADHGLHGYASEDVRLIRGRPGTKIPMHTHEGEEATLVLAGYLQDGGSTFGCGEVSVAGPDDNHRPQIVGDRDCICLSVMTGPMRFTGRVGRVLNYLAH
jgi:putative transcriptional regulator